jgi:NDP-sugar pyrophosphorylase family protein
MRSINNTKVVILAGGKGTRFNPFSFVIPKPLMPINQNPIILYLVKSFKKFNFKNFLISTGYQSELIKTYLGDGKKFGVKIKYYDENIPLGTAGPLYKMKKDIKTNEYFFLINGDVYTEINFQHMLNFAKKGKFDVVVGYIKKEFKNNFGVLNIKNNNIESIIEKPISKYNVSSGIYVIKSSKKLNIIPKNKFFTVPELISKFLSKKLKVGAYEINKYWMGIENMENLVKVENRIKKKFK